MPHRVRQSHLTVDFFRFHLWVVMSQNPSLCQFRKKAIQATLDEMKKAGAKDGKSRFGQLFSQLASHVLRRVSKDHRREGWLHTKFQGRHHVSVEMIRSWLVSYRVCECASQCLHVYDLNDVCSLALPVSPHHDIRLFAFRGGAGEKTDFLLMTVNSPTPFLTVNSLPV